MRRLVAGKITVAHVLVVLLTLGSFFALFTFRSLDNNRLTSWDWVFTGVEANRMLLLLISGVILAYGLSRVRFPKHHYGAILFGSSFVIATLFWSESELIIDTSRYFTQAKHLQMYGISYFLREWGHTITAWTDMPVVPFLYGLIFKFLGESRLYIQIFTTLLFSGTVVLTYQIGKILWNEELGFWGGLLLLGIPYLYTQVPLMLVDVPTMFFLTLTVFAFIKTLNQGGAGMTALAATAIFLTFYSKYSTLLMLSILVVIFLVSAQKSLKLRSAQFTVLYRGILVALISGLLIGLVFFFKYEVMLEQIRLLLSYQQPGLRRWGESFVSTFFFQIHPFLTAGALFSTYVAFRKRDWNYLIISWMLLLVLVLQIQRIRYIILVFPMLALMAAYGLQEIRNTNLRKFIALSAVVSSLVIAVFAYLPFVQNISATNLSKAGEYLNSLDVDEIEVIILPLSNSMVNPAVAVPIFDLFTDKSIFYQYNHNFPSREKIKESPLRFTWGYKNPEYYVYSNSNSNLDEKFYPVIVIISGDGVLPDQVRERLKGYQKTRVFDRSTGIFRYQTIIEVFQYQTEA